MITINWYAIRSYKFWHLFHLHFYSYCIVQGDTGEVLIDWK